MAQSAQESEQAEAVPASQRSPFRTALVAVAVFGSFLGYSLIQAPIPAPNEPHYLTKAKHYWDPDFCPGDFFLDSSNAHLVFYQTVGLLTLWLSLPQTAFVGRLIAYALLAVGWTSCVSRLVGTRAGPLWAAWVFLAIVTVGNLSGEWMVGGVEAKVFSYAFVLLAMSAMFDRRWRTAGVFAGLAVSFHPVVGGWAVVAGGMATVATRFICHRCDPRDVPNAERKRIQIALLLGVVCALPGLVPAIHLVMQPRLKSAAHADTIQVFERLGHHLDPRRFETVEFGDYEVQAAWLAYTLLGLFVLGLYSRMRRSKPRAWFGWFVAAAGIIALGGLIVGLVPLLPDGRPDTGSAHFELRVSLMKFYPFRLVDVFLPIAAAVLLVAVLERRATDPRDFPEFLGSRCRTCLQRLSGPAIFAGFLAFAWLRPIADRNPSHMAPDEFADWKAACRWCDENLPPDAVVLTPPSSSWGFKWYAHRAEYVSFKDCPQDTPGIVEWERRLQYIDRWGSADENYHNGYTQAALRKLGKKGITHVLMDARIQFAVKTVYPRNPRTNERFRVYRVAGGK